MEKNYLDKKYDELKFIKDILKNYYGLNRFVFTRSIGLLGFSYKIEFLPYRYYFNYHKRKNFIIYKNCFPSWNNTKIINGSGSFEENLISWIKNIKQIHLRKNQINISIEDGAEKRKQFDEIVKKL